MYKCVYVYMYAHMYTCMYVRHPFITINEERNLIKKKFPEGRDFLNQKIQHYPDLCKNSFNEN